MSLLTGVLKKGRMINRPNVKAAQFFINLGGDLWEMNNYKPLLSLSYLPSVGRGTKCGKSSQRKPYRFPPNHGIIINIDRAIKTI